MGCFLSCTFRLVPTTIPGETYSRDHGHPSGRNNQSKTPATNAAQPGTFGFDEFGRSSFDRPIDGDW